MNFVSAPDGPVILTSHPPIFWAVANLVQAETLRADLWRDSRDLRPEQDHWIVSLRSTISTNHLK